MTFGNGILCGLTVPEGGRLPFAAGGVSPAAGGLRPSGDLYDLHGQGDMPPRKGHNRPCE